VVLSWPMHEAAHGFHRQRRSLAPCRGVIGIRDEPNTFVNGGVSARLPGIAETGDTGGVPRQTGPTSR